MSDRCQAGTATVDIDITLACEGGAIMDFTVAVPIALNADNRDGNIWLTADHNALNARLSDALEAFAEVATANPVNRKATP